VNVTTEVQNNNELAQTLGSAISRQHMNYWTQPNPSLKDLTMDLPDKCIDELDTALKRTGDVEIPDITNRDLFPACEDYFVAMRGQLDQSHLGAVIVNRLPSERYNEMDNRRLCGMFSSFVGPLMEQNFAGVTLYDVKNLNPPEPSKVRKSITNHAQPFHTDGGWHRKPAKYVGLYCVRSARNGGGSSVTSMLNAFRQLEATPNHLAELLLNHPWDMQGEHAADKPGVEMNPLYELHGDQFLSRYYESYVRAGYRLSGSDVPENLDAALVHLREVLTNQVSVNFEMESGQFQYLNNWTVLHGRGAFDDNVNTPDNETRHVIRVWNH